MPGNFKKEDLRILKTDRALTNSLSELLLRRDFTQITVNDLCEEAKISRATFYSHFNDKYDLLSYWLEGITPQVYRGTTYDDIKESVNDFIDKNKKLLKNLLNNANNETVEIMGDFLFSFVRKKLSGVGEETNARVDNEKVNPKFIVISKFCSGGMLNYLLWQINNKFPSDLQVMNVYFYDILSNLLKWCEDTDR